MKDFWREEMIFKKETNALYPLPTFLLCCCGPFKHNSIWLKRLWWEFVSSNYSFLDPQWWGTILKIHFPGSLCGFKPEYAQDVVAVMFFCYLIKNLYFKYDVIKDLANTDGLNKAGFNGLNTIRNNRLVPSNGNLSTPALVCMNCSAQLRCRCIWKGMKDANGLPSLLQRKGSAFDLRGTTSKWLECDMSAHWNSCVVYWITSWKQQQQHL